MTILITGGAGSIGSEVAKWLRADGEDVRVLDNSEQALWEFQLECPDVDIRLGDVTNPSDLEMAMLGVDMVVHAAALKHVPFCEQNFRMSEAVNFRGTANVAEAAAGRRLVYLSTDKAIAPVCQMGRDKARAERLLHRAFPRARIVRFGNVIGSRGSIVPAVRRYRRLGLTLPITDPEMTRFFMPVGEAVAIVIEALRSEGSQREFTTTNPQAARVGTFLDVCLALYAPGHPVDVVGPRPGERTHEALVMPDGTTVKSNDERYLMGHHEIVRLLQSVGPPAAGADVPDGGFGQVENGPDLAAGHGGGHLADGQHDAVGDLRRPVADTGDPQGGGPAVPSAHDLEALRQAGNTEPVVYGQQDGGQPGPVKVPHRHPGQVSAEVGWAHWGEPVKSGEVIHGS